MALPHAERSSDADYWVRIARQRQPGQMLDVIGLKEVFEDAKKSPVDRRAMLSMWREVCNALDILSEQKAAEDEFVAAYRRILLQRKSELDAYR